VLFRSGDIPHHGGRDVLLLSDKEILAHVPAGVDRIHIIRFEELGPVLQFYLSPILWTSDLDIQVRVRTLDTRTGSLESDVTARWRKEDLFFCVAPAACRTTLQGCCGRYSLAPRVPDVST